MQVPLFRLQCEANSYEWGKKGKDSAVAKFAAATPSEGFSIEAEKPYAELWMGSHPKAPSKHLETGRPLTDLFEDNQALLSQTISSRYGPKLPFLFKVLSINKALSIQAHPNKTLAGKLHKNDGKNYPDDNHKPEMAIALTDFEGLCGFRPLEEICHFFGSIKSLRELVGEEAAVGLEKLAKDGQEGVTDEKKKALQKAFGGLMSSSEGDIKKGMDALLKQTQDEGKEFAGSGVESTSGEVLAELVQRLHGEFDADIGIFVLFFLNFVKLSPGEAMFLVADDIHAYLSGDIMECMAASDNVVRAGLTPKFKDVDTLVDMLTYNYAPIEEQKMTPTDYPYVALNRKGYSSGSEVTLYDPPIEEFAVVRSVLKGKEAKATFEALDGPSIVICTEGEGTISVGPTSYEMKEGYVYFVGSTATCVLESTTDGNFTTFKAFCEVDDSKEKL